MTKKLNTALTFANATRQAYRAVKAPSTQNVRNPFPMHVLVRQVLTTLPNGDEPIMVKKTTRFTYQGKRFCKYQVVNVPAHEVLGSNFYQDNGDSINYVVAKLRAKGFIANRGTVAQALIFASYGDDVRTVKGERNPGSRGKLPTIYFKVKK